MSVNMLDCDQHLPGFTISSGLRDEMNRISGFRSRAFSFAPHVAPVETDLIITKRLVADFSSSMIECPRLFVLVDIILVMSRGEGCPLLALQTMATFTLIVRGGHGDLLGSSREYYFRSPEIQMKAIRTDVLSGGCFDCNHVNYVFPFQANLPCSFRCSARS